MKKTKQKHKSISHTREQENAPEENPNEAEIINLPNKELKEMVIGCSPNLTVE